MKSSALKRLFSAITLTIFSGGVADAGNFVTVSDVTINTDRIQYIEPVSCTSSPGFNPKTQESDLSTPFGECHFNVVFGLGEMDIQLSATGYSAQYEAKEKVGFTRSFGPTSDIKTQNEAEKQIRELRSQLPG